MEKLVCLLCMEEEDLEKKVLHFDKYLVEGEYWLQNTSMLDPQFPHHLYVQRKATTESRM